MITSFSGVPLARRRAAVVAGGGRAGVFLTLGMPPVLDSGNAARAIMPMASGRPALRQDGQVTGGDLLQEAAEELYSSDPDEFIERRGALAARARAAGQAPAANRIAALRKPTRSAWVLNQLVRSAPGAASQLAELGAELRTAQRALEGPAIRELSLRRRQLIDALARQAFTVAGQHAPAAALRDEVTGTLGAALADPRIAEQLQAGTLERAARSDGFGPSAPPALTLMTASSGRRRTAARKEEEPSAPARPAARAAAPDGRAESVRERRRHAIAVAERAVAAADKAADAAARAQRNQECAVRLIEERLADARGELADARLQARRAVTRQRQARQALDRLQK